MLVPITTAIIGITTIIIFRFCYDHGQQLAAELAALYGSIRRAVAKVREEKGL